MKHLFCFGLGFSASAVARRLAERGWKISGTSRDAAGVQAIQKRGYDGYVFDGKTAGDGISGALATASHVLISAAPDEQGDPVLRHHAKDLAAAQGLEWIGYLSTIGVYGDFGGAWIDETAELNPASMRGRRRVEAEAEWLSFGKESGGQATRNQATRQSVQIFRLAGIYGPGRSPLTKLRKGTAKRIAKPGQVFNRIHVEDLAGTVIASIAAPETGGIYNVVDDEPMPPQEVIVYAAELIGMEPPPEETFDTAKMTEMARSFYGESKRVSNARLKQRLGYTFQYPTFREGLQVLADNGE